MTLLFGISTTDASPAFLASSRISYGFRNEEDRSTTGFPWEVTYTSEQLSVKHTFNQTHSATNSTRHLLNKISWTWLIIFMLLVHQIATIPPSASQFPIGGSCVRQFVTVLYERSLFLLSRLTDLLFHGGSITIKSKRDVFSVHPVNTDDADGNVSHTNVEWAGI